MGDKGKRALALLYLAGFFTYCCNHACMIYVPLYVVELGGSLFQAGLQATAFLAAAVLLRFWSGPLADRKGPKLLMLIGLAAYVVTTPLLGFCHDFASLLAVRCVQATGMAAFFPCATASVGAVGVWSRSGLTLGMYRLMSSVALMAAAPAMFVLVQRVGYGGAFAACGLAAALGLGAIALVPSGLCWPRGELKADNGQRADSRRLAWRVRDGLLLRTPLAAITLGVTLLVALGYGLATNFATSFAEAALPQSNAGVLMALVGAGGLLANPLAGWVVDRWPSAKVLGGFAVLAGAGISFVAVLPAAPWAMEISGILIGTGYFGAVTSAVALLAKLSPAQKRASLMSQQQSAVDVGIGSSGALFGAIAAIAGLPLLFMLTGGVIVVAAVFLTRRMGRAL